MPSQEQELKALRALQDWATGLTATAAEANILHGVTATTAQVQKLATLASSAAELDAAVAGTPLVYRKNVTTAQVNAGATAIVPAVSR